MPSALQPTEVRTHVAIVGAGPRARHDPPLGVMDQRHGPSVVLQGQESLALRHKDAPESQVTLFTDDSIVCSGPIRPGPSLYTWAADRIPGLGGCVVQADSKSRVNFNLHLRWCLSHSLLEDPFEIPLKLSNGRTLSSLAAVILAQCHVPLVLDIEQRKLNAYGHIVEEVETKTTQENVLPGSNNRKINICWVRGRDAGWYLLRNS
jgi:hypothetical protein